MLHKNLLLRIGTVIIAGIALTGCRGAQPTTTTTSDSGTATTDTTTNVTTNQLPSSTTTPTPVIVGNSTGLSNKSDTSDPQLQKDEQNIQSSLNQLQQDQGTSSQDSANQSLNTPASGN